MVLKKYPPAYWFALTLIIAGLLLILLSWSPPRPTQAGPELPPRATPISIPNAPPAVSDDDEDKKPVGAYLGLQAQGSPDGVWTGVQWQDSVGRWHDVEGWQGELDDGQKLWWVAQRDFNTGPFRWVTYEGKGGRPLAKSESFYLPGEANQCLWTEALSLAP